MVFIKLLCSYSQARELNMEVLMTVDRQRVKTLREAKAWSQDHLAQVSGVSLRTIQRVEAALHRLTPEWPLPPRLALHLAN